MSLNVKVKSPQSASPRSKSVKPSNRALTKTSKMQLASKTAKLSTSKGVKVSKVKPSTSPANLSKSPQRLTQKGKDQLVSQMNKARVQGYKFQKQVGAKLAKSGKTYTEVHTTDGKSDKVKRIDYVKDRGKYLQPYSVKHSNFAKVQQATWKKYVNEAAKYPGRIFDASKSGYGIERGRDIGGKPVLVMPKKYLTEGSKKRLQQIRSYAGQKGVKVKLY